MKQCTRFIRKLTLCQRRRTKRECSSNMRWMHLSHGAVGRRHVIQKNLLDKAFSTSLLTELLHELIILQIMLICSSINPHHAYTDNITDFIIQLIDIHRDSYNQHAITWFILDHQCHDISPLESYRAGLPDKIHLAIRLDSWSDAQCYLNTSFLRGQLIKIYRQFDLPRLAGKDGYLRIHNGCYDHGRPCCYRVHPEELFLFFMARCKTNKSISQMVNDLFGGWCNRWSYAWPWMLRYLDRRYRHILGHEGLIRFRDQFPKFAEAIEKHVSV